MTRVVLDSNVFISGMVFGGRPRMILQLGEAGNFHIAISKAIRTEVEQVLLRKFGWSRSMVLSLRSSLWLMAEFVHPAPR